MQIYEQIKKWYVKIGGFCGSAMNLFNLEDEHGNKKKVTSGILHEVNFGCFID